MSTSYVLLYHTLKEISSAEYIIIYKGRKNGARIREPQKRSFNLERIFQLPWKPNVHFEITGDEEGKFKVMCDKQPNAVVEFVQAIDALRVYKNKR